MLAQQNIQVVEGGVENIIDAVFKANPLIEYTDPKDTLSTDYKRNVYFRNHFPIIEPAEYTYRTTSRNTLVYVSVIDVLESLLIQEYFSEKLDFGESNGLGLYQSFRDEQCFKNKLQDECISIVLYIDDFEICRF